MQEPVPISGVWLIVDRDSIDDVFDRVHVLVEVDGEWREIYDERILNGPVSHCVHPAGIRKAPIVDWPRE